MVARTARVRAVCTSNGGTALEATFSQPRLGLDRCNQRSGPHDVYDAREIVSEDVERHLGGHALPSTKRPMVRQSTTNRLQTWRMARPLSLRKSAIIL